MFSLIIQHTLYIHNYIVKKFSFSILLLKLHKCCQRYPKKQPLQPQNCTYKKKLFKNKWNFATHRFGAYSQQTNTREFVINFIPFN